MTIWSIFIIATIALVIAIGCWMAWNPPQFGENNDESEGWPE